MPDIKLSDGENALWNEVGSRGDMFRAAMRDRAHEETRVSGKMTEICDPAGVMLDSVQRNDPVPETVYDPETEREVANLPELHKGEPGHPQGGDATFAAGALYDRDRLPEIEPADSGRVIAGELHGMPQKHPVKDAAHDVAKAVSDVAHKVGDRAKDFMHKT